MQRTLSMPFVNIWRTGQRVWQLLLRWLRDVPIVDPVDRRNAPMLQLISVLLAALPSAAWCYRAFWVDIPWRAGEITSMVFSLSVSSVAIASFFLTRKGRFSVAAYALLGVFAVTIVPAYLNSGFGAQRFDQPVLAIWLAIAALIVGRLALWFMFLSILVAFFLGIWIDIGRQGEAHALSGDAAFSAAMFFMITIVLDRSSAALRESLHEAKGRGDALDIANQRLTEEMVERERTFTQLIQAQKIEAVGRLASGVAHDFGNVLMVMDGYVRSGLQVRDSAGMRASLAGIESSVTRANLLTRRLLSLAHHEDGIEEWFDAGEALENLMPMVRQLVGRRVSIEIKVGENLPAIFFDRMQFDLMVLNVAANADHAMPDGGMLSVVARRDDDHLLLELIDSGTGMEMEVLKQVFEPFFTTRPRGQGSGLGLSVVRDMIERAGGTIKAESTVGLGTTISMRFAGSWAEVDVRLKRDASAQSMRR